MQLLISSLTVLHFQILPLSRFGELNAICLRLFVLEMRRPRIRDRQTLSFVVLVGDHMAF